MTSRPAPPGFLVLLAALAPSACASPPPTTDASSSGPPRPSAAAPPPVAATVAPAPSASEVAPPPPPVASAAASAAAPPADAPAVDVTNIGMHIGGGKNDAAEKAPIKRSVEPHLPAFAACFGSAEDPTKGGDFGVDLRIEKEGGKAKVSHPRTSLKGDAFKTCVLGVFEAVDFEKPKGGTSTVSYSLRFAPRK
jgi:hypothetical protein